MMELMGMAQVIATIAYGIQGLKKGHRSGARKPGTNAQMVPEWSCFMVSPPPGNRQDPDTTQPKRVRYCLILVRLTMGWLRGDRLKDLQAQVKTSHRWIPAQQLPFDEIILYAYAADHTSRPAYVCLPSGLLQCTHGTHLGTSWSGSGNYAAARHLLL